MRGADAGTVLSGGGVLVSNRDSFPKTDDDQAWVRSQVLVQLERLRELLEDALRQFIAQGTIPALNSFHEQYNENVERLIVTNAGCVTRDDLASYPPLTTKPRPSQLSSRRLSPVGMELRQLLDRVSRVLEKCRHGAEADTR
jgi:hypothetical protein